MEFFKINGKMIASPKDVDHSYEILDKIERTLDGTMVVDKIGFKNKITVSWDYLTKEDMMTLRGEIIKDSFSSITYQDSDTGTLATIYAKPKDITYQVGYDWVKSKVIWKNVSVSFEEK